MKFLNRPILVIKPKQPYLDWTHAVNPDGIQLRSEDVQQDCTTYLLARPLDRTQLDQFLRANYSTIFEHELRSWHPNEEGWPTNRNYNTFQQWFAVEAHSQVIDLAKKNALKPDEDAC
jgi:hypothetical protein